MSVPQTVLDRAGRSLTEHCILHVYRGSIAHGMYVPDSDPNSVDDKDTMAVCVPPLTVFWGVGEEPTPERGHGAWFATYGNQGTVEIQEGEWDVVIYEIRKAIWLMAVGNPTMLSLLWVPERYVITSRLAGRELRGSRNLFVSRHAYKAFVGYATDQFVKMERGAFQGYMGERRRALVEQYGYDTKNAAHLIRILRMGIEFLRDGELIVDRGGLDASELLAIKRGEWSLEKVKAEATRLFIRAEEAYDRSTLPARPDWKAINSLCVETISEELDRRRSMRL